MIHRALLGIWLLKCYVGAIMELPLTITPWVSSCMNVFSGFGRTQVRQDRKSETKSLPDRHRSRKNRNLLTGPIRP